MTGSGFSTFGSFSNGTSGAELSRQMRSFYFDQPSATPQPWASGYAYNIGDIVTSGADKYRSYTPHVADAASQPDTGSNWSEHWAPYDPDVLLKPVFVQNEDLLRSNGALYEFKNITQAFYFKFENGKYDKSYIDPGIFQRQFYDKGIADRKERYRADRSPLFMLDIEDGPNGEYTLKNPDSANWQIQLDQMAVIGQQLRSGGNPAAWYVNYNDDVLEDNAIWLRLWVQHNFGVAKDPNLIRRGLLEGREFRTADAFRTHLDICAFRCYQYYEFPDATSQGYDQAMYHLDMNIKKHRALYPNKYRIACLQPNFTQGFNPIDKTSWNHIFTWCMNHDDVDAIMIFKLDAKTQADGWTDIFAPNYAKVNPGTAPTPAPVAVCGSARRRTSQFQDDVFWRTVVISARFDLRLE